MASDVPREDDGPSRRERRTQERAAARATVEQRLARLESALGFEKSRLAGRIDDLDRRLGEADGRAREGYRRQAGFLDLFRRQQGDANAAIEERLTALEAELLAASARLVPTDTRLASLEASLAAIGDHLGALDTFRGDLGAIIERIGQAVNALRESVAAVTARVDAAEAMGRQHGAESDLVRERLDAVRQTLEAHDARLVAAEAVLQERGALDQQLERAEAVERLLIEVDPDRFATRADLDRLRTELGGSRPDHHAE